MAAEPRMVTGLFRGRDSAERAYQSVSARGNDMSDINLAMSDETRKRHFSGTNGTTTELGDKAAESAGVGGAIGGTVGMPLGESLIPTHRVLGGLVVPLYFVIIATMGGLVSMMRRVPEFQRRIGTNAANRLT